MGRSMAGGKGSLCFGCQFIVGVDGGYLSAQGSEGSAVAGPGRCRGKW